MKRQKNPAAGSRQGGDAELLRGGFGFSSMTPNPVNPPNLTPNLTLT